MKNAAKIFFVLIFPLFCVSFASSQQTPATEKVDENTADVSITGSVTAKELKFEAVPNPKVEFPGTPERKTEWSSVRTNLPDQVQPNVIYRNIGITLRIVSVFADIDKIVDDALSATPQAAVETEKTTIAPVEKQTVQTTQTAKRTNSRPKRR